MGDRHRVDKVPIYHVLKTQYEPITITETGYHFSVPRPHFLPLKSYTLSVSAA